MEALANTRTFGAGFISLDGDLYAFAVQGFGEKFGKQMTGQTYISSFALLYAWKMRACVWITLLEYTIDFV